jgi:predicted transcriptional regulator
LTVKDLIDKYGLKIAAGEKGAERLVKSGYCGDLLSDVMANAPEGCAWLTIQSHQNIIAVAVLREMACIIITGGHTPDAETAGKAETEGIPILLWPGSAYILAGTIYSAGIK